MTRKKLLGLILSAILLAGATVALAAGGSISGIVTDPRGAVVPDAIVTVLSTTGAQPPLTATTDQEGRYKFEGLAPGSYTISVSAKGFAETKRASVTVEEGISASADFKLELSTVGANVNVPTAGIKGNSDPVYQKLRTLSKDPGAFSGTYATINNLVLQRDAATFTLRSGEIYFLPAVENRVSGAVFIGDGEIVLVPPTETEKRALAIFTEAPELREQVTGLVLQFTDNTFDEIKSSPNATVGNNGPQASKARELYRDKESLLRKDLRRNFDVRTLSELYAGQRPGNFVAFINGKRFSKLFYEMDPLGIADVSPEEIALVSYGEKDGGIWTAFHLADEYKNGTATSYQDRRQFDITRHTIDCVIKGTRITATDTITLKTLIPNTRVLPFDLFRTLRVNRVQDEQGNDLAFIQEAKDEDAELGIILNNPVEVGKEMKIVVQYDGEDALRDSGGGNFILIPRSTWYPNNGGSQFGDRAIFEATYRYPKGNMLVGTGAPAAPEIQEGNVKVAKWTSGALELAVAGFNYGKFKKKELIDEDSGYGIEFYANTEVPDEIKQLQLAIDRAESAGLRTNTTLGSISTSSMGDNAIADTQNATRIYNAFFGKLPYTRIAMTQQPAGNFGQAWPTLVFMPYTAFIDTTQRIQLMGTGGGNDDFWRYVGPHEVAHQWWGHMVGWTSYHDQWMSEGFAEFSTSLYVQLVRKDIGKFMDFWEDQRKLIIEDSPQTRGKKPYTVGPVTQGYRLNNAKTGSIARRMIYPKGAYILHMVRMMMYDQKTGDAKFREMMTDFIKSNFNKDVSTEDFKHIIEKHITPLMDMDRNGKMDWFFDEWVYGTEMPQYKFEYTIGSEGGKGIISGRITQSGVSDNFRMLVPIYADFGNGWMKLGSATLKGNTSVDIKNLQLPAQPKRVAACAFNDVLFSSIDNKKL